MPNNTVQNNINPVKKHLESGTLLFDGSMGTYFAQIAGRDRSHSSELANLYQPSIIRDIHSAYIAAGAQAIKTNTFSANRPMLSAAVPDEKADILRRVITAGCHIAQEAVKTTKSDNSTNTNLPETFIFADIGPIPPHGKANEPSSDLTDEYREIIDIFLDLGIENFLFETFANADYLPALAAYIKEHSPQAFIITSFAVQPDGFTHEGVSGENLLRLTSTCPDIDAVGFNCVSGPYHLRQYLQKLPRPTDRYLSVMPNASYPTVINNRTFFGSNPEYYAAELAGIAASGARIIGGCCGTTPEYIAAAAKQLAAPRTNFPVSAADDNPTPRPAPLLNDFRRKAEAGRRLVAVELEPPKNDNLTVFMQKAHTLQQSSVDIITIPDCPIGRAAMDSSLLACKLKRETGIDVLPHLTCRDRNLNATKALLLGLSVEGINNVLIITGDPIPTADRSEVKSVFNFNSRMLAAYISSLNESLLQTPFYICGALNLNAVNFDIQLKMAEEKLANGVNMLLTQPVLSPSAAHNLKRAHQHLGCKILAGIMPVVSHRNACFMNSEIAGITVCPEITNLYLNADRDRSRELAVSISTKIAEGIADFCDGYYIISPFNRVDIVCDIIHNIKSSIK